MNETRLNLKLAFIGGGNMAQALIVGLKNNQFAMQHITVVELDANKRETLSQLGVIATDTLTSVTKCDVIVLAIEDITDRKEIERRKDDFLSIASHELKTPLTTIKGYVQILSKSVPDQASDKFKSTLSKVSTYVDRLNNLISDLKE